MDNLLTFKLDTFPNLPLDKSVFSQSGNNSKQIFSQNTNIHNVKIELILNGQISNPNYDKEYCNLIVLKDIDVCTGYTATIPINRVIQEDTQNEIIREFSCLDSNAINRIKSFPCLILMENEDYRECKNKEQKFYLGLITDVQRVKSKIQISFAKDLNHPLNQQDFNLKFKDLIKNMNPKHDVLDREHWIIFKIDIIKELIINGFEII